MKLEDIVTKLKSLVDKNTSDIAQRQKRSYCTLKGESGKDGYIGVMDITITANFKNTAISFKFIARGNSVPTDVSIIFNNENTTDPTLLHATISRTGPNLYIVKIKPSTWRVYFKKGEPYDVFEILELYVPYQMNDTTIDWDTDFTTSLPAGARQFTTAG